jgi:CHAT domain-containing protein
LYKNLAARLYTWLIRPLEAALASASVQTLVFVPDGPLRTFPLAALYDGTQFLIRKYAVAITPGLDVVEPRPLSGNRLRVLVAGVSVAVQDRPPLPHVVTELEELRRRYDATILHNQNFSLPNLEAALRAREYDVVHIASHGQFASNVNDSHVLMYEGKLTLDQLERVISRLRLRDKPLGLLTLSACETALGDDDRAALGLAGIAIKAGASSALATLWQVNDAATSLLITAFYRHLQQPMVSRAVALQRAQIELLDHPDYQDPFFWAGLLLINNWL